MKREKHIKIVRRPLIFVSAIVFSTVLLYFSFGIVQVSGTSMYPRFSDGEVLLYTRLYNKIGYGDIIIFKKKNRHYIKRVYGRPGDTVSVSKNGTVFVNKGPLIIDGLLIAGRTGPGDMMDDITLEEDEYFVLGDNRRTSLDSRSSELGTVKKEDITGIYLLKLKKN